MFGESEAAGVLFRLERLAQRVARGAVVPFVGAGISNEAHAPGDGKFEPTTKAMCRRLRARIAGEAMSESGARERRRLARRSFRAVSTGSLNSLAEVVLWLTGSHKDVCGILQIGKFADLEPLPAHFYLAFLMREGLVSEVFSTNYDCCLEKAFERTLAPNDRRRRRKELVVVRTGREHRRAVNERPFPDDLQRPPGILYKLNGCAKAFSQNPRQQAARILITERQLQAIREGWKRDFFRGRCRTNSLLFLGFGSEEPQVRHTMLAVMEDLRPDNKRRLRNPELDPFDEPTAPFVAAHGELTFAQAQVLAGFAAAYADSGSGPSARHLATCRNVFAGDDARALGAARDRLSADLFLERLYQAVLRELLTHHAGDHGGFSGWLSAALDDPEPWRSVLLEVLYPQEGCAFDRSLGTWRELVVLPVDPVQKTPLLSRWFWAILHPGRRCPDAGWYLPIRDEPVLVLSTLLLLVVLTVPAPSVHVPAEGVKAQVQGATRLGLEVRIPAGEEGSAVVYLVAAEAVETRPRGRRASSGSAALPRFARRIAVPSGPGWSSDPGEVRVQRFGLQGDPMRIGRCEELSAAEVLRRLGPPGAGASALVRIFAEQPAPKARARTERLA